MFDPHVVKMHKNHPSAVWARVAPYHYIWLCKYGLALCKEYTFRYKKVHKCQQHIEKLYALGFPPPEKMYITKTPRGVKQYATNGCPRGIHWFALAMPTRYLSTNAEKAYKRYYMSKAYGSEDEKMKKKASNKRLELEDRPDLVKVYNKCKRKYIKRYCIF